jgi:hypothetical protein
MTCLAELPGWIEVQDDPDEPLDQADYDLLTEVWPGFADLGPATGTLLLKAAKERCLLYAAPLPEEAVRIPAGYTLAQIRDAQGLARQGYLQAGDSYGLGETVSVYPMDWTIQRLLRAKTKPVVA